MSNRSEGIVVWFTGLPCSGKTTLSDHVKGYLAHSFRNVHQLDGDRVRRDQPSKLGFTKEDRIKNVRGVVAQAAELSRSGSLILVSLITPYQTMRDHARSAIDHYVEVYVKCPLAVCEARDVKGMYRLARAGKINNFTGLTDPYEEPESADLIVETDHTSIEQCSLQVIDHLLGFPTLKTLG